MRRAFSYVWAPFANLLWYIETIVMGTISLVLWPFDKTGEWQHACARIWCRMVAVTIGARLRVHGAERLKPRTAYVYMANHSSLIDTPALFACLPYQFKIMAKRGLFYVPFAGWHLWSNGHFPIERGNARATARSLRHVIDALKKGSSLAVFPEGTRTPDGQLQEFKAGAFKLASRAGVPIVPVSIRGTFALLPKTTLAPLPGVVDVVIGEPIPTSGTDDDSLPALMASTRASIQAGLTRPVT